MSVSGRRWAVTALATVASTWALDLIATTAGVVVVATGVLDRQPRLVVVGFLAATYVIWAAGLRVNLAANGRLLTETGASTNALSKVMFDVARRRSTTPRFERIAAATGYVIAELGKEAPYYAGAFGTVLVSDSFDATDGLIFLGGANIGAGIYEYGIARLTRTFLAHRHRRILCRLPPAARPDGSYASFDIDWEPQQYLTDYYRTVEPDERATIAFFVDALRLAERDQPILLFGVGPTLHHVFLTAGTAAEIHLAEYLPANLNEIERWMLGSPDAHDWSPFVRYTLECEGVVEPTSNQVCDREALTRAKITKLLPGDARHADPLSGQGSGPYGTVISAYCADSATSDLATWETYLLHIAGLVRPGGLFITAALRHSTGYVVGGKTFPSASVDESDVRRGLAPLFDWDDGAIEVVDLASHRAHGYASIILVSARRRVSRNSLPSIQDRPRESCIHPSSSGSGRS